MSALLSLVGWSFLPSLASSWIQTIYYGITIRAGDAKPLPGSARYNAHRRRIQLCVVALYLAYTIYEADHDLRREPSFYEDLGVSPAAASRDIKSRFRRLAALHHPDKAGSSETSTGEAASYFMHLKLASDTLQDAAARFAYDRFGSDITTWTKCVTIKDFVTRGVAYTLLPHYALAASTVYIFGLFGYMDFGKFYRWLILIALCLFEVHTVTRPDFPPVLDLVNVVVTSVTSRPPYLPYQMIALLRKITLTVYIALSQIGPLLISPERAKARKTTAEDNEKSLRESLVRLEAVSKQLDVDANRLMDTEVAPFKGDASTLHNLQTKMREWLVQNTIRADPMVRDALGTSLRKRRVDAPAGAKGNR